MRGYDAAEPSPAGGKFANHRSCRRPVATVLAMEPGPVSALSDEDELSLWVGRVAREHALLEYGLSNVHGMLDAPEEGVAASSVGGLVRQCRRLLNSSSLQADIVHAGRGALTAASAATTLRNRVIHDMWLPNPLRGESEPARWNTFRRSTEQVATYVAGTPEALETVVDAHNKLSRSRIRVSGLFMSLHEAMPHGHTAGRPNAESELPRYVAMMNDQFTVAANGDVEIDLPREHLS